MSAFRGKLVTGEIATGTAAKTLVQLIAPANHRLRVVSYKISFKGTSATAAPIKVRLLRQSTAGTMSALTPVKLDDSIAETLLATAQHTATAEPTAGDVLESIEVHPQSGYEKIFAYGEEPIVGGGDRIGIEVTAGADVSAIAEIQYEE